jgi:hypothetical protein
MSNAAIMVPGIGLTGVHIHPKAKSNEKTNPVNYFL